MAAAMISGCVWMVILAMIADTRASQAVRYQYEYMVVGAGPAGLQLAYFLKTAGRDYLVLERAKIPGSFFSSYPRHGTLISLNKRHTGQTNKEFNFRHDWNSLISDDESLLMRHYSKRMFPPRKSLLKYLNDYEKKLELNVRYNVTVKNIEERSVTGEKWIFMQDQKGQVYKCRYLIIATGLWVPNKLKAGGFHHAIGYEKVSTKAKDFEGKSVLILGNGNSAFEVAERIYGSTNVVHMMGRSRIKLSWQTHYVGDLRAVNNNLLDTYQLKSLDAALETNFENLAVKKLKNGQFQLYIENDEGDEVDDHQQFDNFCSRKPYDVIVSALGWKFDNSIFKHKTQMRWSKQGSRKYPLLTRNYKLYNFNNVYVAGTLAHSLDYKQSAGAFIHGFRYTARALHRVLEHTNHNMPWPSLTESIYQLLPILFKRLNEASGIYQMFSNLCDVIIIDTKSNMFTYYEEFPVVLIQHFQDYSGYNGVIDHMVVVMYEYGANFSGAGADVFRDDRASAAPAWAHTSNFLHPVMYYYNKPPTVKEVLMKEASKFLPRPDKIHHIVEDFLTEFDAYSAHLQPTRRFLESIVGDDMREQFAEDCLRFSLTHRCLPPACHYFSNTPQASGVLGQHIWHDSRSLIIPDINNLKHFTSTSS